MPTSNWAGDLGDALREISANKDSPTIGALFGHTKKGPTFDRPKVKFGTPARQYGGAISEKKENLGEFLESKLGDVLRGAGLNNYDANRWAGKTFNAFNDLTPLGNATGSNEGAAMIRSGIDRGDVRTGLLGAAVLAASVLPYGSKAKKPLQNMLRDTSGAIRAWHGSPHDFDKFDISKIGTGEGHQSFGTGLYFAENPDVARGYQGRLSKESAGRLYEVDLKPEPGDFLNRDLYLGEQSPKVQAAINEIPSNAWDWMGDELDNYGMNPIEPGDMSYKGHHLIRALEKYSGEGEIAAHIPWDDPRQHVSEFFRQQGLPGFTFLDKGSRHAPVGAEQTRNYVVFDDSLIDILNKY